jgi:hypothetical protein
LPNQQAYRPVPRRQREKRSDYEGGAAGEDEEFQQIEKTVLDHQGINPRLRVISVRKEGAVVAPPPQEVGRTQRQEYEERSSGALQE